MKCAGAARLRRVDVVGGDRRIVIEDLGTMPYREAWARQERVHGEVLDGGPERLLFVEHPPVITLGRRPALERNILAPAERLAELGVEVVHTDRGGDVTFHGPGQLVAYPIVRLLDRHLSVGTYVRRLQEAVIQALADFDVAGKLDPSAVGVWVEHEGKSAKICALGVRIKRGVSIHGIALNVAVETDWFNLIVPCGLPRPVTSLRQVLGERAPSIERVRERLAARIVEALR